MADLLDNSDFLPSDVIIDVDNEMINILYCDIIALLKKFETAKKRYDIHLSVMNILLHGEKNLSMVETQCKQIVNAMKPSEVMELYFDTSSSFCDLDQKQFGDFSNKSEQEIKEMVKTWSPTSGLGRNHIVGAYLERKNIQKFETLLLDLEDQQEKYFNSQEHMAAITARNSKSVLITN